MQQGACSLSPAHGSAVLRGGLGPAAPAAFLFYGPHSAGHQHPAALHVDIHLGGQRLTDAARLTGYGDPLYLTWGRTTLAANTVVVDRQSMFPYDFPTESIWECDRWRDSISDGELQAFAGDAHGGRVRAINTQVYPGVRLERFLRVTAKGVWDEFRVEADRERLFDYVFHCVGRIEPPPGARPIRLGRGRGYMHLREARVLPRRAGGTVFEWAKGGRVFRCELGSVPGDEVIMARDPTPPPNAKALGETVYEPDRTAILCRVRARSAVFSSFWSMVGRA